MNKKETQMHLRAAAAAGQEKSCGTKRKYGLEQAARMAAASLNQRAGVHAGERSRQEAYPCPFCDRWHTGRAMTPEERKKWSKPA